MAYNNVVILTGNLGDNARIVEKDDKLFAAFSMATQESYKDENDQWQKTDAVWHKVLAFDNELIQLAKTLDKGTRITITGSLSYREFSHKPRGKKAVKKREASIIAHNIEPKPLV